MSLLPLRDREVAVVVHRLEVPGGDRSGHHDRRRDVGSRQSGSAPGWSGRQAGSTSPSSTRRNVARTGMPMRTSPGSTPVSSATSRTTLGEPDQGDDERQLLARHRRVLVHDVAVDLPVPAATWYPWSLTAPQDRQDGPGGWRRAPHCPQRWTRSSPCCVPAQKNAVSGETTGGRMTAPVCPAAASRGVAAPRRPRRRPRPEPEHPPVHLATGSSPEYQTFLVLTNQPSPSAVRLGPVTSASPDRTLSSSPCRRYRW